MNARSGRLLALAAALALNACSGGSDRTELSLPTVPGSPAPIVDLDTGQDRYQRILSGIRHVGADVAPTGALSSTRLHDGVPVSHGRLKDGVGRDRVVAWLQEHLSAAQEWGSGFPGLPIHASIPVVRVLEGTSAKDTDRLARAIGFVNTALPPDRKLRMGSPLPASTERDDYGRLVGVPMGTIVVEFAPAAEWRPAGQTYATTLHPLVAYDHAGRMFLSASHIHFDPASIWIDPHRGGPLDLEQNIAGNLVHELIHALGFLEHPDMVSAVSYNRNLTDYGGKAGHVLYPLDREGILAAYARREPNTQDIDTGLGPWADTSVHIAGEIGGRDVRFGAAARNGFAHGWAQGRAPALDLADNRALSGSASWSGRLLGLTPSAEAVAGAADLTVDLESLTGDMDFTGLESWAENEAPGAVGTGIEWGDGDLEYTIAVDGNTFVQTGGDEGAVTGAFFGPSHEGMGGVLERTDLSAGFGGKR